MYDESDMYIEHRIPRAPVQSRELNEQFVENSSIKKRLVLLSQKLRLDQIRVTAMQQAIDAMVEAHGQLELSTLARQAGLSLRQLRRRCREYTGISPKLLCRILRFRDALSKLYSPGVERGMKLTPVLYVDQIDASLPFWTDRLGFEKTVEVPEENGLGFVILVHGNIEVMLQTWESLEKDAAHLVPKEKGTNAVLHGSRRLRRHAQAHRGLQHHSAGTHHVLRHA